MASATASCYSEAIANHIQARKASGEDGEDIKAQGEGSGPADSDIVDECVGFLFAGHETTASTLTWALYELATNPEVQEDVAIEGDGIEGDGIDPRSMTLHDDAEAMTNTAAVVEEILRLYPPTRTVKSRLSQSGPTLSRTSGFGTATISRPRWASSQPSSPGHPRSPSTRSWWRCNPDLNPLRLPQRRRRRPAWAIDAKPWETARRLLPYLGKPSNDVSVKPITMYQAPSIGARA